MGRPKPPPRLPPQVAKVALRQGVRAIGDLIRLPQNPPPADPWELTPPQGVNWQKGKQVARRGAGVAALLGLALLATVILLPLVLLLGVGSAGGSWPATVLLVLVLLAGLAGLIWTGLRVRELLRPASAAPDPTAPPEENALLTLLREYGPQVSEAARPALQATVLATRDALRATAGQTTLTREGFDARQAARSDLPELLHAYHALPVSAGAEQAQRDQTFLEQLRLIEGRMQEVRGERRQAQERQLRANGAYLRGKYQPGEELE